MNRSPSCVRASPGSTGTFPCPCCGHLTFSEPPGSYDICPVCFWEDDVVQLRWLDYRGGANGSSLIKSQRQFLALGSMNVVFRNNVREAKLSEPVDTGWRLIDPERDDFEPRGVEERPWPDDYTSLYWWRPTFWRDRTTHDAFVDARGPWAAGSGNGSSASWRGCGSGREDPFTARDGNREDRLLSAKPPRPDLGPPMASQVRERHLREGAESVLCVCLLVAI